MRARLHENGYSDEDIVKILGMGRGAGAASEKFTDRLPGGDKRLASRTGQGENFGENNRKAIAGQKQDDALARYQQKMGQKGFETMAQTPTGMTENVLSTNMGPGGASSKISVDSAMKRGMTSTGLPEQQPDGSNTGTPAVPDKTTTTVQNGPDGQPNQVNTETTVNENAEAPAAGGAAPAAEAAPQHLAAEAAPAAGAAPVASGGGGVNPNVQNMAQQFQAGQDMQAIQQGKGAEKQSWLKNRSGMGKLMDVATFGATSRFGGTGGAARSQANQQSQQQTQNYQAANQRMNQRAMGMNAPMIATSLDSQLSAYSDIISIRKGIQERNTTHNLRR